MKYELVLQGDKKIILSKDEADSTTALILEGKKEIFKIGENVFKRTVIKGIFPIAEEIADNKEQWLKSNKEWNDICKEMSKYSLEDKITIELTNRILPGLKLNKITLTDLQIATVALNIRQFFIANPKYPRCPMRIWWPLLRAYIPQKENIYMGKWWEYVSRNDGAINEWLQYNLH